MKYVGARVGFYLVQPTVLSINHALPCSSRSPIPWLQQQFVMVQNINWRKEEEGEEEEKGRKGQEFRGRERERDQAPFHGQVAQCAASAFKLAYSGDDRLTLYSVVVCLYFHYKWTCLTFTFLTVEPLIRFWSKNSFVLKISDPSYWSRIHKIQRLAQEIFFLLCGFIL